MPSDFLCFLVCSSSGQFLITSSVTCVAPALILFCSQSGVVTFHPLWFPSHGVTLNLQFSVSRRRVKPKVVRCSSRRRRRRVAVNSTVPSTADVCVCVTFMVTSGFQGDRLRKFTSSHFVSGSNSDDDDVGVKLQT